MWFSSRKTRRNALVRSFRRTLPLRLVTLEDRTVPTAGMLDPTFGVGGTVTTDFSRQVTVPTYDDARAIQADGKIVVAGSSYDGTGGNDYFAVVRYNADGSLDSSFGNGGRVTIDFGAADFCQGVAMQGDKIVVAGRSGSNFAVARLNGDGTLDATFDGDGKQTVEFGTYSNCTSVAVQGESVILGGYSRIGTDPSGFFDYHVFAVARLTGDGQLDLSFNGTGTQTIDFGSSAAGRGVAIQADGSALMAGYATNSNVIDSFISDDGQTISVYGNDFAVARLTSDGQLDTSFNGSGKQTIPFGPNAVGTGVALKGDDKIVVAGSTNYPSEFAVAQLNADGTLDTTFDGDGKQTINFGPSRDGAYGTDLAVQDGKIVVAGYEFFLSETNNFANFAVARLNPDGSLDSTFSGDGKQTIDFGDHDIGLGVAVQGDKIVLAGQSVHDFAVARLNNDGTLDSSFDGDGKVLTDVTVSTVLPTDDLLQTPGSVVVQSDGKIVVAGRSSDSMTGNNNDFTVARYDAGGNLDPSFGTDGRVFINFFGPSDSGATGVVVQGDGKIVVAGYSDQGATGIDFAVARLNADGTLDHSFDGDGKQTIDLGAHDFVSGVAVQGDKIVMAGSSYVSTTVIDFVVTRLNADGTLDNSFDNDGKQTIDFGSDDFGFGGVAVQGDKIVVAGESYQATTGHNNFAVARLNADGTLDSTFDGDGRQTIDFGTSASAAAVMVQGDKIVVAGNAQKPDASGWNFAVARLNADGTPDYSFDGDGQQTLDFDGYNSVGYGVAVQGDKVVMAGYSDQEGTGPDFAVARLNADGTLDNSFDGDGKQTIDFGSEDRGYGVAVQGDGKIVVAGYSYQGATNYDFAVARLLGDPVVSDTVINGTADNDIIRVTLGNNPGEVNVRVNGVVIGTYLPTGTIIVNGLEGNDDIEVAPGVLVPVWLFGGAGCDELRAGGGNDMLFGDDGDDRLFARLGDDALDGGAGNDELRAGTGSDVARGGDGCDELWGGTGNDQLYGDGGNDVLRGGGGCDRLEGGDGNDELRAGSGGDMLLGGNGNDTMKGGQGSDWLEGGDGNDRLDGMAGDDVMLGGAGDDLLMGGAGRDLQIGGLGADRIEGNSDEDILIAGYTLFDANATALTAIMAEWTSGNSYATRVANITGGTGLTQGFRLWADDGALKSVFDDDDHDVLCGGAGIDWFFANVNGPGVLDTICDLRANELWTDTDF